MQAAQELLTQAWGAAERLCGPAPLLVRLAVEAEVRLRDWRALAAAQRAAAEAGDAGASLSWEAYQGSARASLELLQGALPSALQEAQAASAKAAAAVAAATVQVEAALEDGEVPADKARSHSAPCAMRYGDISAAEYGVEVELHGCFASEGMLWYCAGRRASPCNA